MYNPLKRRRTMAGTTVSVENAQNSLTKTNENVQKFTLTSKEGLNNQTSPKTPDEKISKTVVDAVMARIQRDLNSPSAASHWRGQKALKSPGFRKANYEIFDIPHEEQEIITEEERQPFKEKTIKEIFENCRLYVDIRSGDDNRSAGIKAKLAQDGITINERLTKNTTHVIFKNGLVSTFNQAKKLNIPITNILWIEKCKQMKRLVDPSQFKIIDYLRYENPELYGKMRVAKGSQPVINSPSIETNKDLKKQKNPATENISINKTQDACENVEIEKTIQFSVQTPNNKITSAIHYTSSSASQISRVQSLLSESKISTPSNNKLSKINFNSANRISIVSRRSIADVSMNIFELNCKALEERKENDENNYSEETLSSSSNKTVERDLTTQIPKPAVIRKRKLFTDADTSLSENYSLKDFKENINTSTTKRQKLEKSMAEAPKSKSTSKHKDTSKINRRRTMSCFKTEKDKSMINDKLKLKSSSIQRKTIVCTNMSAADKLEVQAAVKILGGDIESEVSDKTTHVVTPTIERTMNLLRGVINACYIVNIEWIKDSVRENKFLDTTIYQHSVCNSQKINEKFLLGKRFKNHTFTLHGPFFIQKETIDNAKKYLYVKEIILKCGGVLTANRTDAKIIVSDRKISTTWLRKPIVVTSTFIFDSAMQGKIVSSFSKYAPKQ